MGTSKEAVRPAFDLSTTYVQLDDGPQAFAVEVDDEFWQTIDQRPELQGGRLVGTYHNAQDWDIWEMHPAGDEVVCLLSGAIDVVLDEPDGERVVELEAERRASCAACGTRRSSASPATPCTSRGARARATAPDDPRLEALGRS